MNGVKVYHTSIDTGDLGLGQVDFPKETPLEDVYNYAIKHNATHFYKNINSKYYLRTCATHNRAHVLKRIINRCEFNESEGIRPTARIYVFNG